MTPSACASTARGDREGDDLDGRHHLARLDDLEGRGGRERQAFMHAVERLDPVVIDDDERRAPRHEDWRGR